MQKLKTLAVMRLDDPRFGAGPATVLEISAEPIREIQARYVFDRDGCAPAWLRFWQAWPGAKIGDRASLGAR